MDTLYFPWGERYGATLVTLRISDANEQHVQNAARAIAIRAAEVLRTQGANITFGSGLWKGEFEHGATIEVAARYSTNADMELIRDYALELGLTVYATVIEATAFELY